MRTKFIDRVPTNVTNGAIYNTAPGLVPKAQRKTALRAIGNELAFDIDMDAYDHLRQCCKGKRICRTCWADYVVPAVKLLEHTLTTRLYFYQTLWTFSGSRGVHCRVFDKAARDMDNNQRQAAIDIMADAANRSMVELHLDE